MTRQEIDAVFERVKTWPLDRLEDAARTLMILEDAGSEPYVLSEEEERDLDEGEAGGVASEEEVEAFFRRYRS